MFEFIFEWMITWRSKYRQSERRVNWVLRSPAAATKNPRE